MLSKDIKKYVIDPALSQAGWDDAASKLLIYGTGMVETGYNALMQFGAPRNGGVGFFQEEPSDYNDLIIWLKNGFNRPMLDRVLSVCNYQVLPDISAVVYNIAYAALICRMHYHRVRKPIPTDVTKADDFAAYHKEFYNSSEGKADVGKNTSIFQRIIDGEL